MRRLTKMPGEWLEEGAFAPRPKRAAGSGQTVLVIDHQEDARRLASRILVSEGYGVITASDGIDGLAIYRRYRKSIAAVILDMAIPGLNGAQVISAIKIFDPEVRILPSGQHKPFGPDSLVAAIRGVLG